MAGMNYDKIGSSTLKKLFSNKGLCVFSKDGKFASEIFKGVDADWQALSRLSNAVNAGDIDMVVAGLSKSGKLLNKISKVTARAGVAASFIADLPKGFSDTRTSELALENFDWTKLGGAFTVDLLEIGTVFASRAVSRVATGAVAGSVAPGVGNVIGAGVGIALIIVDIVPYGEPHITLAERVEGGLGTMFKEIGRNFKRTFN
jgi:hypothetical protein